MSYTRANLDGNAYKEAHKNSVSSWASLDYDQSHEQLTGSLISKNPKFSDSFLSEIPSHKDGTGLHSSGGSSGTIQKADHTAKPDDIPSKPNPPPNPDTKRAKQYVNYFLVIDLFSSSGRLCVLCPYAGSDYNQKHIRLLGK